MSAISNQGHIYYKCRLCGETFARYASNDVLSTLMDLMDDSTGCDMLTLHHCSTVAGATGVADLIGGKPS